MIKSILAAIAAIAFVGATAFAQEPTAPAGGDAKPTATAPAKGKKLAKRKRKKLLLAQLLNQKLLKAKRFFSSFTKRRWLTPSPFFLKEG